ncbi:MAG: hypothetical protein HY901_09690, partial [Deltaproteobacteria bacterium]|nr:hypothetical protein [Deltaproteobacteria bacterium]
VVALGHDEVVGPNGQTQWSLAVSLIDVSTQQPALLSRVTIDGAWGWVPAENDDFAKVFRILPEANLIVFPFSSWDPQTWRHLGGVQLIDFFPDRLAKRGVIGNAGWVERGVVHGVDTVLTLSSEVFQVMDIADRDQPQLRGRLELARNVLDFAVLNGTHTAQLGGDWYRGDTSLTITPIDDPDTASPVASIHVPAPYGRLFQNGQLAYITSVEQTPATSTTSASSVTRIKVVDLTNPAAPVERGSMTLPEAIWGSYGYWYWGYGDEVVQVNGSTLAFHHYAYDYGWYDCYGCSGRDGGDWAHRIYLVDLSDPDQPRLASTVVLDDMRWAWGLRAQGNSLLMSAYDSVQHGQQWYARYHLRQIDLTDLDHPMARAPVSIPGWLVGTSPSGPYVFTLESWWDAVNQKSRTTLHALELYDGVAYLQSSTEVDGYLNGVEVVGDTAFGVVSSSWQESVNGSTAYRSRSDLVTYDLSTPQNIHRAGQVQVPDSWGWLRRVAGGRAFVVGGAGVFAFRIDDPSQPTFDQFFRTYGWVQDVVVHGNKAFLPSGYYGVQVVDLNTP